MFPEILRFIIEEGVVSQCSHIPFLFPSTCIHRTQIAIFLDMHLLLLTSPKQTYNQQAPSRSATPSQPMLSTPRASSPPPPVMQLRQVCVYLNSFLYVSSHPSVCLCVLVCVRVCVCANSTGWRPKKSCASHLSTFLSCFCYACLYMSHVVACLHTTAVLCRQATILCVCIWDHMDGRFFGSGNRREKNVLWHTKWSVQTLARSPPGATSFATATNILRQPPSPSSQTLIIPSVKLFDRKIESNLFWPFSEFPS